MEREKVGDLSSRGGKWDNLEFVGVWFWCMEWIVRRDVKGNEMLL